MIMDKCIQIIKEEFELAKDRSQKEIELAENRILSRIKRLFDNGNQTSAQTNKSLKFTKGICRTILTGEEIKGEGNTSLEVAVVDDSTGDVVAIGPEASARVEIVLLKGNYDSDNLTAEEFERNIVPRVGGKRPLLDGNLVLKLQRGVVVFENIKIRHHAIDTRPSVFKLGARIVGSSDRDHIREAQTESFTVKDFRIKYYKKHETPALSDEVSRLVNIRKGGNIDKRLKDNKISTVEDFLIRLLIDDPEELKQIVKLGGTKKWEATVNNARACLCDKKMYSYMDSDKKMGVLFNVLGHVLGLYPKSSLPENYKADAEELLASAYKHWGNVKPFDDMNSFQQYLTSLSTSLYCPGGGPGNTGTEIVGESSTSSKFPWHFETKTLYDDDFPFDLLTDDMEIDGVKILPLFY